MGVCGELFSSNGWPMTASSDEHAISLIGVEGDQVKLRDQADSGDDGTEGVLLGLKKKWQNRVRFCFR